MPRTNQRGGSEVTQALDGGACELLTAQEISSVLNTEPIYPLQGGRSDLSDDCRVALQDHTAFVVRIWHRTDVMDFDRFNEEIAGLGERAMYNDGMAGGKLASIPYLKVLVGEQVLELSGVDMGYVEEAGKVVAARVMTRDELVALATLALK